MNWMKALGFMLIALGFMVIALLSSCESLEHTNGLQQFASQLKQAESKKTAKKIPIMLSPAVTYQADTLRSPFQEPATSVSTKGSISTPLQAYPLTTLRFAGTVTEADNTSIAYILTPDNMIYQVKVGDTIGDNNGKVTHIYADRLLLTEQNTENKKQAARVITLKLKDIH